jgi:hypothetical protein
MSDEYCSPANCILYVVLCYASFKYSKGDVGDAFEILPYNPLCMPTPFVHLHNHSEFSLLDGATKIKDMVK